MGALMEGEEAQWAGRGAPGKAGRPEGSAVRQGLGCAGTGSLGLREGASGWAWQQCSSLVKSTVSGWHCPSSRGHITASEGHGWREEPQWGQGSGGLGLCTWLFT